MKINYLNVIAIHTLISANKNILYDKQRTNLFSERFVPLACFTSARSHGKT